MYIVKERKTKRIAGIFKDKEEATNYITIAEALYINNFYIVDDPAVTEDIYKRIRAQALIDYLMDPKIINDILPERIINTIKALGGTEK